MPDSQKDRRLTDTTLRDHDITEEFAKSETPRLDGGRRRGSKDILLIVADGELEMTGHDTVLLVVTSGIASEFEDFGGEIFEDGCEVH